MPDSDLQGLDDFLGAPEADQLHFIEELPPELAPALRNAIAAWSERAGDMKIGLSNARISWPNGRTGERSRASEIVVIFSTRPKCELCSFRRNPSPSARRR
jgi:hypothetical protein